MRHFPPQLTYLAGFWDMTSGSRADRARNKASLDAPASKYVGADDFNVNKPYLELGAGAYIDTGIQLAATYTMIIVAKPLASVADMAGGSSESYRPTFMSDYNEDDDDGSWLWVNSVDDGVDDDALISGRATEDDGTKITSSVTLAAADDILDWRFLALSTLSNNKTTLYDRTLDDADLKSLTDDVRVTGRNVLIGRDYDDILTGPVAVAMAAIYNGDAFVLSDLNAMKAYMEATLSEVSISI
ncbi:hypothetical protein A8B76_05115 [Roseovarius indicus]|nr:hypothetical protein A8B76_05115 [Roseovarius indicus]